MILKSKLLGAGAALLLSTGAALAVPATAQTDLNVRSGPGTQYPVVGSIQSGETVDAGGCTGSWCQVNFNGGAGYASSRYLAIGGGAPGPAVAAAPYVYDEEPDYGYYDDGYAYGPSAYIYANPRFRHRNGWHGRPGWNGGGNWAGRPGGWAGRPGGTPPVAGQPAGSGFAGPPANWQRPGSGIGAGARIGGGARVGGGNGFAGGGSGFAGGGGAPAAAAPAAPAGGGSGFAGSLVRGR